MNQIVSLFMFSCGDYEKVKQEVLSRNKYMEKLILMNIF